MRQRLGIAQALLGNPRLLILDEPTNGLDPAGIRELRAFIRKLSREEGISFLISSHILHEVQLMCDRVAVIHQGEIIRTGPIHQLVGQSSMVEWKVEPIKRGMQLLKSLSHIKQLESTPTGKVLVHMPTEKIAETNAFLMQQGVQVFEIRPYRPTLEDIFLEMTGGVQRG
jgi:ABC-2 type transport system ATP-binding protein